MRKWFLGLLAASLLAGCAGRMPSNAHMEDTPKPSSPTNSTTPPLNPPKANPNSATLPDTFECPQANIEAARAWVEFDNTQDTPVAGSKLYFDSFEHGWLVPLNPQMSSASVYETHDGGQSWSQRITVRNGFVSDMIWSGKQGAVTVINTGKDSSPDYLTLYTRDAGETWTVRKCEVRIASLSDRVIAGIARGQLYLTEDGGDTWKRLPPPEGYEAQTAVVLRNGQYLAAIMQSDTVTNVFVTSDRGTTWSAVEGLSGPAYMDRAPNDALWVIAINQIWINEGDPDNWIFRELPNPVTGQPSVSTLEAIDGTTAWAKLLDKNAFLVTNDQGRNWREIALPSQANAEGSFGVAVPEPGTVYVIGDWQLNHRGGVSLWRTTDGGRSWERVSSFRMTTGGGGG